MTLRLLEKEGSIEFDVRVAPRSSREAVLGIHAGALKLAITAPPVDGEANAAVVAFLAKRLGVSKSQVRIVRGETGRSKTIEARGVDAETVLKLRRGLLA